MTLRTWPAIDVQRLREPEMLQAALHDYDIVAVDECREDAWRVYFHSAAGRDAAAVRIAHDFPDLTLAPLEVPDEDWAARSQADLRAIRVDDIIVAPPWDTPAGVAPAPPADGARRLPAPIVVVIQPSMGFGTGHHATTRLCLAALQRFDMHGRSVLDVGTGSGVLAIAASRLGATPVIGIDDDPDAVQSARENGALNRTDVDFRVADLRTVVMSPFDLVLANLTGALIVQSAGYLQDLTSPRGPLILSGFTSAEEASVVAAFPRLRPTDRGQEDEWVCLTLQRETAFE